MEIPAGARILFIAGQVGVREDGTTPESAETQLEVAWNNVKAVLQEAGMEFRDLVKVTCFIKNSQYATAFARSVNNVLGGGEEDIRYRPAMTAPIVRQLWQAEWFFEIEAVAAKID